VLLGAPAQIQATSIVPPTTQYQPGDVIWFSASGSNIVAYCGDGNVRVWSLGTGKLVNRFKISDSHTGRTYHYLAVSRAAAPRMAVSGKEFIGEGKTELEVYGLVSGKKTTVYTLPLSSPDLIGFSDKDDLLIISSPADNRALVGFDCETGKVKWRSDNEDDVQSGTAIAQNAEVHVNFCRGNKVIARDRTSKILWQKDVPKGQLCEPGYWPEGLSIPYVVAWESYRDRNLPGHMAAYSARDGSVLWTIEGIVFGSLKAISPSGGKQVISDAAVRASFCFPKRAPWP